MEVFSCDELLYFNNFLLKLGVSNEKDDIGYNNNDYWVCRKYANSPTQEQLYDLSERLVKYCDNLLCVDTEIMKNTNKYYKSTIKNKKVAKVRNVKIKIEIKNYDDKCIELYFKYDCNIINSIRKLTHFKKYNSENKSRIISKCDLPALKGMLDSSLYDLSGFDKFIEQIPLVEEKLKIKLISCNNGNNVLLRFSYNLELFKIIRSCEGEWEQTIEGWYVDILQLPDLINKIKSSEVIIDISELENYQNRFNSIYERKPGLIDVSNLPKKPFKHQLITAKQMLEKHSLILALEQGLGKTLCAVLVGESISGKKLVICPASLKLNWRKEIEEVSKEDVFIAYSNKEWINCNGWTIINYDIVDRFEEEIKKSNFVFAAADEAHYIRSIDNYGKPRSKRAVSILNICKDTPYCYMLSGTPIANHTRDVFNLLKGIRSPIAKSFNDFAKKYCDPKYNGYAWNYDGTSNEDELYHELKKCMVRILKKDALDLPEKINTFIPLEIDLAEYNKELSDYMKKCKSYNKAQHLVKLTGLKLIIAKQKVKDTIEFADNILLQNEPVVIFTMYTDVINELKNYYKSKCVLINGSISSKKRQQAVEKFQNGEANVFLGNIQAAGTGLTLTRASNLIFNDYSFLPTDHQQASDRIHRIGQKHLCNIYYMYAANTTIDEVLTNLLDRKLKNISKIIDGEKVDFIDQVIKALQHKQNTFLES